jgi:hypothetical protein
LSTARREAKLRWESDWFGQGFDGAIRGGKSRQSTIPDEADEPMENSTSSERAQDGNLTWVAGGIALPASWIELSYWLSISAIGCIQGATRW